MFDCDLQIKSTACEQEQKREHSEYCTNPVLLPEQEEQFLWLDDLGWL